MRRDVLVERKLGMKLAAQLEVGPPAARPRPSAALGQVRECMCERLVCASAMYAHIAIVAY